MGVDGKDDRAGWPCGGFFKAGGLLVVGVHLIQWLRSGRKQ